MTLPELAEEIKDIYTEFSLTARWSLIEMYHEIGKLIVSQRDSIELREFSNLTSISERNLYRAVQFNKKYPDLNLLPEGKNVSWHQVVNKYLPDSTGVVRVCDHEAITICRKCRAVLND